jgi:hypothetical protein
MLHMISLLLALFLRKKYYIPWYDKKVQTGLNKQLQTLKLSSILAEHYIINLDFIP